MWEYFKNQLQTLVQLSNDALHIHVGLLVIALSYAVFRSRGLVAAWIALLVACALNEAADLYRWSPYPPLLWGASLHDVINTMFWPTVLVLFLRRRAAAQVLGSEGVAPD